MIEQSILDRILKRYQKVIQYSTIDPEVALGEARKTAEAILKVLYTQQNEQEPGNQLFNKPVEKKMLSDLASIMEKIKRYPLIVATAVRTIQAFGNIGAHDQGAEADHVDEESIQACTTALKTLMKWFWKDSGQDMSRLSASVPEKSQNQDESTPSLLTNTASELNNILPALSNIGEAVAKTTSEMVNSTSKVVTSALDTANPTMGQIDSTAPSNAKSPTPILVGIGVLVLLIGGWFTIGFNDAEEDKTTEQASIVEVPEKQTLLERISKVYEGAHIPVPPTECQKENEQVLETLKTTPVDRLKASIVKDNIASSILLRALLIKDWNSSFNKKESDSKKRPSLRQKREASNADSEIKTYLQTIVTDCSKWSYPHAMLGNYWYEKEDYAAAQAEYAVALADETSNPEARFNSTIAYLKTKEFDKALEQINTLEQTHPNHPNLYLVKTQVLVANEQFKNAAESGVKAYNNPNSSAKAALLLWQIHTKLEQPEKANEYACSAVTLGMKQATKLCKETK